MTSELTVAFTGTTSELQVNFFPEIILENENEYFNCAFLDLLIMKDKKATENVNLKEIFDLDLICVNCDLISGSYINGVQCRTIHQFTGRSLQVKGGTVFETPEFLNFFRIKNRNLQSIQISITDKAGVPINTKGANIICRIKIVKRAN